MKELIKKILVREKCTPIENIISVLSSSSAKVVSFDIFDTLIKRNVREATDVFSLLENAYINQFGHSEPIKNGELQQRRRLIKGLPIMMSI